MRLLVQPVMPALPVQARRDLRSLVATFRGERPSLLDIGGRKSPYTIGLDADVTVLDIPRATELQSKLHLGMSDSILASLQQSRSNIVDVVLEDMTTCTLPDASYDIVSAVEVLEYVPDDQAFLAQAARVLRPGGWLYLTTPNGEWCLNQPPSYNPDHLRHYRRDELEALIDEHFVHRTLTYSTRTGVNRKRGLQTMDPRHPVAVLRGMAGNVKSQRESRHLLYQPRNTTSFVVVARKPPVADLHDGRRLDPSDPAWDA